MPPSSDPRLSLSRNDPDFLQEVAACELVAMLNLFFLCCYIYIYITTNATNAWFYLCPMFP